MSELSSGVVHDPSAEHASPPSVPDERLGTLLGLASQTQTALAPSERRLALDTLSILLPQASAAMREQLMQRLRVMEKPPRALLLTALHMLPGADVAALVEEARLPDDLLVEICEAGTPALLEAVVARRRLSAVVCTALAQHAPPDALARMLRNEGAEITEPVWWKLLERAMNATAVQQALAERTDLPVPIACELFWHVSSALRRRLILQQPGTSAQMEKLLQLAHAPGTESAQAFLEHLQIALATLLEGDRNGAARRLASFLDVHPSTIRRISRDATGEAFAIMVKSARLRTHEFGKLLTELAAGRLARLWPFLADPDGLRDFYAAMSVSRARATLLYWDWRSRNIGPYAHLPPVQA